MHIEPYKWNALSRVEQLAIQWQFDQMGGFQKTLMHAITQADDGNLVRLEFGVPDHVRMYLKFSRENGWWAAVCKKAGIPEVYR